jgi:uncharacterized membrane protein YgdD (TMEM256/DUF423 family)
MAHLMTSSLGKRIAGVTGFLAVLLGAFGAHGLSERLNHFQTAAIWETAVFYHLTHAILLVILSRGSFQKGPWLCFLCGIAIFSGSLYVLAAWNIRWLGAITPLGGLCLLAGWAWLGLAPVYDKTRTDPGEWAS